MTLIGDGVLAGTVSQHGVRPLIQRGWCPPKRRRETLTTDTDQRRSHVTPEAEAAVMRLQAKDAKPPGNTRS